MSFQNEYILYSSGNIIQASPVPSRVRHRFWQQHFSQIPQWVTLEARIFSWMSQLCEQYDGGIWKFYTLSNYGAFIAPDSNIRWSMNNEVNGNSAEMSSEAAGIAVCLLIWSHHASRTDSEAMTEHFYSLREFALSHPESSGIMRIID